ncbi:cytotoxic and regulatory T-cell molecule-like [Acipenser oxyrinchus oxyrinchus]|uniref:Cytotoxic and regulatory T-cell molecule-like n=1 Tax=Acipenser oxyrinchus oxyrinchus TaxID=40147 RepID=A0AAD8FSU0_ACIOX|nr:cytotoxic and regulatory T-cell molecule-like [Acipenser oxyrinchus oxyrinchus]
MSRKPPSLKEAHSRFADRGSVFDVAGLTIKQRVEMTVKLVLLSLVLTMLTLKGKADRSPVENVTVVEGETVTLNCTVHHDNTSHLQWSNPRSYIAFFNGIKVLKDRRYSVVAQSKTELTISLSNVTVLDKGMYSCLHYIKPVSTKKVYVDVLAPPSQPVLEMTQNKDTKTLRCSTRGSYPPPNISWSINTDLELDAHTQYRHEGISGKTSAVSTLVIRSHRSNVRVDCIVQHAALRNAALKASITIIDPFQPVLEITRDGDKKKILRCSTGVCSPPPKITWLFSTGMEMDGDILYQYKGNGDKCTAFSTFIFKMNTPFIRVDCIVQHEALKNTTLKDSIDIIDNFFIGDRKQSTTLTTTTLTPETTTMVEFLPASTAGYTASSDTPGTDRQGSATTQYFEPETVGTEFLPVSTTAYAPDIDIPETSQETTNQYPESTTSTAEFNSTSRNLTDAEVTTSNYTETANETSVPTAITATESVSGNVSTNSTDPEKKVTHRLIGKKSGTLLVVLVSFLICALLVIVLYFVSKLKKAHDKWKREIEESSQSLESNKSKSSNEERLSQERRCQVIPNYNFMKHTVELHTETETGMQPEKTTQTADSVETPQENRAPVRETEL